MKDNFPKLSKNYSLGYYDGYDDAVEKACKWIMNTPMYAQQPNQLVEDFRKAMDKQL